MQGRGVGCEFLSFLELFLVNGVCVPQQALELGTEQSPQLSCGVMGLSDTPLCWIAAVVRALLSEWVLCSSYIPGAAVLHIRMSGLRRAAPSAPCPALPGHSSSS